MNDKKDAKASNKNQNVKNTKKNNNPNNAKRIKQKSAKENSLKVKKVSREKAASEKVYKKKALPHNQVLQKKQQGEKTAVKNKQKEAMRVHSKTASNKPASNKIISSKAVSDERIATKKAIARKKKAAKKKRERIIKKLLGIATTFIMFVIIAYCGYGYAAYSDMFMPGTTVNGIECGNVTSSEFIDTYNNNINNYSLTIKKNGDVVESIKASDVKLTSSLDMPKKVRAAIQSQNKLKWALGYLRENKEITLDDTIAISENAFNEYIKKSKGYNLPTTIENKEQSIVFADGKYSVSDPVYGDEIDKEAYTAKVKENMLNLNAEMDLESSDCYTKPASKGDKESYAKACDEANKTINYGSLEITAEGFDGDLAKEIIEASLVIDDNFNASVNKDTIEAAIKKVSAKYNTMGTTRKFKTSHGTIVDVEGGDYGRSLKLDDVGAAVEDALLNGKNEKKLSNIQKIF